MVFTSYLILAEPSSTTLWKFRTCARSDRLGQRWRRSSFGSEERHEEFTRSPAGKFSRLASSLPSNGASARARQPVPAAGARFHKQATPGNGRTALVRRAIEQP